MAEPVAAVAQEGLPECAHALLTRLGIELVSVPAGEFLMGTDAEVADVEDPTEGPPAGAVQPWSAFTVGTFTPARGGEFRATGGDSARGALRSREHPQRLVELDAYCCGWYARCPAPAAERGVAPARKPARHLRHLG